MAKRGPIQLMLGMKRVSLLIVAALGVLVTLGPSAAIGAAPPLFAKVPADGESGVTAGRLSLPRDIAADSALPGDVYVADSQNNRVDEFDAYGDFIRAWGWGVKDGAPELQTCSGESGCQRGIAGSGTGQFDSPEAIAVDNAGHVYVVDEANRRVQKFSPEGAFILMFGREVDQTTGGDVCTATSGDLCGPGVVGTGAGQLGATFYGGKLATSPSGETVYLGDQGRIQEWNGDGTYEGEITFASIHSSEPGFPEVGTAGALEVGPSTGNLYLILEQQSGPSERPVYELTPAGEPTGTTFATERGSVVAVSQAGDVYVVEPPDIFESNSTSKIIHYSPSGIAEEPFDVVDEEEGSSIFGVAVDEACGTEDIYAAHFLPQSVPTGSYLNIFGNAPNPGLCAPAKAAPTVTAQYALSVGTSTASVDALINPHRELDTTYYVEYGASPCTQGGCQSLPLPPGAPLTTEAVGEPVPSAPIELSGLAAGTTYHYRFVAQSSGGGPVYGIDPDGSGPGEANFAEGGESTFTTYRGAIAQGCPSGSFRSELEALLPDCRAYEMVSPVDKEGGDIVALEGTATNAPSVLNQSEPLGEKVAYGTYRAFGGSESSPYTAEYVATRTTSGWSSHPVSPPRGQSLFFPAQSTYAEFKLFSPDLCTSWMVSLAEPPLAPGAPRGFSDVYRRHDEQCGGQRTYEPLNTTEPAEKGELEVQGVAQDGSVTAFTSTRALTPEATESRVQLYVSGGGVERFACVLPGGIAWTGSCTAGWAEGEPGNASAAGLFKGALSSAGSSLIWTAGIGEAPIYLRRNPASTKLECSGATAPCTVPVSHAGEEASGTSSSRYWAASADGGRVLYTTGTLGSGEADLYEFEVEGTATRKIAGEVQGLMGASADARRIYLVSEEDLDGSGPAAGGQSNLYFYEGGSFKFIGVLTAGDVATAGVGISPLQGSPLRHVARVSPDGLHAAFQATAPLTGYDSIDAISGKVDTEVYLYDAGTGRLICASCNPSGARPHGGTVVQGNTHYQASGLLPPFENSLYAANVLEGNGHRLFFESIDGLVPQDANGQRDVYEWEAPGTGGCATTDASYSTPAEGCIDLISSGTSPGPAVIADVSASGNDIFFTTLAGLVPGDPGQVDLYDARVDGGFPSPPATTECQGEACQPATPAPPEQSPASSSYRGVGNLTTRPGCKQAKKANKRRCVRHHRHRRHRHAHRKSASKKRHKSGRSR
jgi:hypothetical protein